MSHLKGGIRTSGGLAAVPPLARPDRAYAWDKLDADVPRSPAAMTKGLMPLKPSIDFNKAISPRAI